MKTSKSDKRKAKIKKRVKVGKTRVGLGVFSRRQFAANAMIGEITGRVMGADFESDYCMDLDGKSGLDPFWPFRFLNHSCEPNSRLILWKKRKIDGYKIPRVWLETVRSVIVGEELTIDYAWPSDAAVQCLCGADSCRGWVVDQAQRRRLPRLSG